MMRLARLVSFVSLAWLLGAVIVAAQSEKPVAGKADVLRHVPKRFAKLISVDSSKQEVKLQFEGDKESTIWPVEPDAELKVHGWWGRLQQFEEGDRVWIWQSINRQKKPVGILMMADELSEQDIHGLMHQVWCRSTRINSK